MEDTKLQTLNKLLAAMDTNAMSSDEITKGFKSIIKHVEDGKEITKKELELIRQAYRDMIKERDESQKDYDAEIEALKTQVLSRVEAVLKTLKNGKDGKDGRDGVDGKKGEKGDKGDKGEPGKMGMMDIATVAYLENELKVLREEVRTVQARRGGGTSAIGVAQTFKWIAHTEAPVGAIDGNNTTYTVKNTIWWVAGFTLNGEQIAELPNFTYAGRTITFATALPAAYSGKDFEIKYIGT